MDIQFITDEYAVAEYIMNYVCKSESGISHLLKNINDEAVAQGGCCRNNQETGESFGQGKGNEYTRIHLQVTRIVHDKIQ